MPSPNLPQLSPRAGNGLGGMPRKADGMGAPDVIQFLLPYASSVNMPTIEVPAGYKRMRLSIIGRGNGGSAQQYSGSPSQLMATGGAGGHCCISKIVDIIPGEVIRFTNATQSLDYATTISMSAGAQSLSGGTPTPTGGDKIYRGGAGAYYYGDATGQTANDACGGGGASFFGPGTPGSFGGNPSRPGQNGPTPYEGRASQAYSQSSVVNGFGIGYGSRGTAGDGGPGLVRIELWP